jgi:hypothetical protein
MPKFYGNGINLQWIRNKVGPMVVVNVMAKRKLPTCPTGIKGRSCGQQPATVQIYLPVLQIYPSVPSSAWYHKPESVQRYFLPLNLFF